MKGILDNTVIQGFIRTCDDGWLQGWHERNGGNLSYRLAAQDVDNLTRYFSYHRPWVPLGVTAENLAGDYFIATGSGVYFRNVKDAPHESICILEINETGDSYRIVWGLEQGGGPTSEFPSHFMNHSVRVRVTGGTSRVIYHSHVPSVIALTFVLPLTAREFSRVLWKMATECPVVFPEGVGVVPWMVPGGHEIALATCKLMEDFRSAVWAHHGLFCSGATFDEAFGLMHTIERSAAIYLSVLSTGREILQIIEDDDLRAIGRDFKVTVREDFLD